MSAASARPQPISSASPFLRPSPRKTMSVTQTYYLAHKARAKLSREAAQPDHDLRLLVGHANLLDSLMMELAEAEREQERWFNQSVHGVNKKNSPQHIQWVDRVEEEAIQEEEYDSDSSVSDDDFDYEDDDDVEMAIPASTPKAVEDEDMADNLEDYAQLELVRTTSHSSSPPELVDHDSESSDDEAMPPSPADAELPLPQQEGKESEQDALYEEDYYQQTSAGLAPTISVY